MKAGTKQQTTATKQAKHCADSIVRPKAVICAKKQRKAVTYSIVWVEDVGGWRVVHNDDFVEIPA